jgi:hypothetical protein
MALSLIGYVDQDTFAVGTPAPATSFLQQVLQSADPADLQAKVTAALAEVSAQNVLIAAAYPLAPELLLTFQDASLAGGGDGHTFTLVLTWVPGLLNQLQILYGNDDLFPENLLHDFCIAGDADNLQPRFTNLVDGLGSQEFALWQAHVGSSQGTRFMAGVIAYAPPA